MLLTNYLFEAKHFTFPPTCMSSHELTGYAIRFTAVALICKVFYFVVQGLANSAFMLAKSLDLVLCTVVAFYMY